MNLAIFAIGAVAILGSLFVIGSLMLGSNADDAAEDLSDRIAHGDIIRLPLELDESEKAFRARQRSLTLPMPEPVERAA